MRAGIRADTGIKMGTYAYEVKVTALHEKWEIRVGFSTLSNSLIDDTSEGAFYSFLPVHHYRDQHHQTARTGAEKPVRRGDVIAVKLARTAEQTSLAIYVNGVLRPFQAGENKRIIPNMSDAPLFPHLIFRGCGLSTNFREKMFFPLTRRILRMIDDCAADDAAPTTVRFAPSKSEEPTIVVPMTLPEKQEEWINTFVSENKNYVSISPEALQNWADKSDVKEHERTKVMLTNTGVADLARLRNFVVGGPTLTSENRQAICKEFPLWRKVCKVNFETGSSAFGGITSLPTTDEGFDAIEYVTSKEKSEEAVKEWNDRSKKLEKLSNIDKGPWFKERWAKWTAAKLEATKQDEYKDFSKEDWLLAELQCRIHAVIHAFKEDVNDPERPSFALSNLVHYAKMYAKPVNPAFYGVESVEQFEELIPGSWIIQDEMLVSAHEKDVDFDVFFKLCKEEREARAMRLEAGDEAAKLTFASNHPSGNKRPVTVEGREKKHKVLQPGKHKQGVTYVNVPVGQSGQPHLPRFTPLQAGRPPKPVKVMRTQNTTVQPRATATGLPSWSTKQANGTGQHSTGFLHPPPRQHVQPLQQPVRGQHQHQHHHQAHRAGGHHLPSHTTHHAPRMGHHAAHRGHNAVIGQSSGQLHFSPIPGTRVAGQVGGIHFKRPRPQGQPYSQFSQGPKRTRRE